MVQALHHSGTAKIKKGTNGNASAITAQSTSNRENTQNIALDRDVLQGDTNPQLRLAG
jgi:hypothetical protein